VGSRFVAALFKADKLNDQSARQVCSHLHLVHAVYQQRKVRQFADFPEIIHFSDGHYNEPVVVIVLNNL
jgi:hypothetical protein